ncbi:MAG: VOC family protein [Stackebrandtia sp.]
MSTVIDARDPKRLARWWAEVLDYHVVYESAEMTFIADRAFPKITGNASRRAFESPPVGPGLTFIAVGAEKAAKNRVHLDLRAAPGLQGEERMAALEAECDRLVALGATKVSEEPCREHGSTWLLMSDPEGNEFCVCDGGVGAG